MSDEKKLNAEQLEAVRHRKGPLLIIAGAGTGKTTVITERIKHLITQGLAQPAEILALTFTEKAAREMETRIDESMPYGYTQMWVMTFHSFCDRVLRDEALNIGLDPSYHLLTGADATSLLKKNIFNLDLNYFRPLGNPDKFINGILQHFSRLKDEDVTPGEYLAWVKSKAHALRSLGEVGTSSKSQKEQDEVYRIETEKYSELAHLYQSYEDLKTKAGVMDFGDLISNTLKLFRDRPNILANYQRKFKYILVDEFQDTNFAQNQLVILLAGKNPSLTVVADDDQAIYRWRGAAVSNVIQFKKTYPDAKLIVLTQNYRSTQEILDRSYNLIQNNNPDRLEIKEKIDKKLVSVRREKGEPVEFIHSDRVENEAEAVAKLINELTKHESHQYRDFAILVRANAHADAFTRALSRHGVPYQFLGPGQLFHQPEIKDLIAYLKVLANFEDSVSFYRVLTMDYFSLSGRDLAVLGSFAKKYNLHLFETAELAIGKSHVNQLTNLQLTPPLISLDAKDTLKGIVELIHKHLSLIPATTAGQILFFFLQDTGMLKSILDYKHPIDEKRANNIMKFFNKLKSFETGHEDASVSAVVDWLDLSMDLGESPLAADTDWTANDAVNILTIHSAKGLEFSVVFLINLVSQRFPSTERREQIPIPDALVKEILPEGDFHLQEERRLFYVGMTRARDRLFLTAADFYGEAKREKKLSPFIIESLGTSVSKLPANQLTDQLSLLDWGKPISEKANLANNQVTDHKLTVNYLSYTQIQTFLDCPLHYKARYILKIPTPPTASLAFGNSIHMALNSFYQTLRPVRHSGSDGGSLGEGRVQSRPQLENLLLSLLAKNWVSEGYTNKTHEAKFFEKGKRFLAEYINTQFDPKRIPVKLEEKFIVPINPSLKIGGKIDRVDVLPGNRIEITDYKTGANIPTKKDVDTNIQLSFYAIAATSIPEPIFSKKPEDVVLSLYYFDTQTKITTTRTVDQIQKAKEEIANFADQISRSDFRCSGSIICKDCEYKMLCDVS